MSSWMLHRAKRVKDDECYTKRVDIENEMQHYPGAFKGKVVYCNCDDPRQSEFFRFFSENFETLGLKRLLASCYKSVGGDLFSQHDRDRSVWLEYNGDRNGDKKVSLDEIKVKQLKGDGDFRSEESLALLKQSDIVVTNPPFSLFSEYVETLIEHGKQFIIIGNYNATTYPKIFRFFKSLKMWRGAFTNPSNNMYFDTPSGEDKRVMASWYTNIAHRGESRRIQPFRLFDDSYQKYDNFDAIECPTLKDIPIDYDGLMGVPITYLERANPEIFDLVGSDVELVGSRFKVNGGTRYARFVIRRRHPATPEELAAAEWRRANPKPKKDPKDKLKAALIKQYGLKCQCCGDEKTNKTDIQLDRINPGSNGGLYVEGNVGLLCARCNIKKGKRVITYATLREEGRAKGWIPTT